MKRIVYDAIPEDFRTAREEKGLKPTFVGEQIGMSRENVYAIEGGRRKPSLPVIFKLSELYGVEFRVPSENASTWP